MNASLSETVSKTVSLHPSTLIARAKACAEVAGQFASSVDSTPRFPSEAFAELKKQNLLGTMIPTELGGDGTSLADVMDICYSLGQACAATAMIYAMHQIKLACIIRHTGGSTAIEAILRRVAAEQLLLASSTTEGNAGGHVRASEAPIETAADHITLQRKATVISYAQYADGIVTTARRSATSEADDQVLLVVLKEDYSLEPLQGWDTLGMRGTRSEGFSLLVKTSPEHVMKQAYSEIHTQTMVPVAHLTWGSVWAGIASAATTKSQNFVRKAARQSGGTLPPGAAHLTQAVSTLRSLRGLLQSALSEYQDILDDPKAISSLNFQTTITLLKVQVSELALSTVLSAMRCCGLTGYRNDSEFSIGRHLRDVLSAPLMINNDRILNGLGTTTLMAPIPKSING